MRLKTTVGFLSVLVFAIPNSRADEVTDWNRIMLDALAGPPAVPAPLAPRAAAIVQAAVFDAVNGIERRYSPVHVMPAAPRGASQRAAAVQAAYASLVHLFPSQAATFDQERTISLIGIASGPAAEHSESIERGVEWGQTVANAIWEWRSGDGFSNVTPPYFGGLAPGEWRPTPPAFAPGLAPQLAVTTPWAILSPSQFRPGGPAGLTTAQYVADFNETKSMGSASSTGRTPDETLYVNFWNSTSPPGFFDPVAISLAAERRLTFSEESRLLALLNIALADAIIGCWDAKYTYSSWRPVTAIPLAGTDGNPDTAADAAWAPVIITPPFPEYPSAHSCASGAATRVLSSYFGENTAFRVASDGMPGVVRYFSDFSAAIEEIKNARVFGGIHFRTACNDGQTLGERIGDFILANSLLPLAGQRKGQLQH